MSQKQIEPPVVAVAEEENAEFYNKQGYLSTASHKYDEAVEWFEKTIKQVPAAEKQHLLVAFEGAGRALRKWRHFDEAGEMFRQALETGAGTASGSLLVQQGWLSFYQKFYAEAFTRFEEAEKKLEGDKFTARVGLLASRQQLDVLSPFDSENNARRLVAKWREAQLSPGVLVAIFVDCSVALEDFNLYPAALNNATQLLENAENNAEGIYLKISALKWLRRYAEAETTYCEAPPELRTNIKIWKERANLFYERKRFAEAHAHYSGQVLNRPDLKDPEKALKDALKSNSEACEWTIVSLRKMRRFDEARIKVNEALSKFDDKLDFLSEQAYIYYAERDYDNAIKIFDRALLLNDHEAFALQWRAACFRKKGKFAAAKDALDDALKKVPYATGLWEELAWLAFDQAKFEEAIAAFDKAIEIDPYLIAKQFSKAETLVRLNRSDDALEVFRSLQQQFPDDAEIDEQLCWFYIRMGQFELAREQQVKIKQSHPHSVLAQNALGGYELAQRNYAAAEKAFREALTKVDYEPQYYVNLALALIRQVKSPGESSRLETPKRDQLIEEAKSNCRAALKLDPYNAKAYGCLGVIAFRQNAFLDAEVYFRKSIELNPTEGSYVELASLYCQMGRYDEATAQLEEALKLNPSDARIYIELGNVAVWKEDNKGAIKHCRQAVFVEPKNPETHRALAVALMRAERYDEAESEIRNALIMLAPAKPWRLYLLLAQILIRAGDIANKDRKKKDLDLYEEALRCVNEARLASAPNADIFFHAGIVQYRLEDYPLSQKSFADCLKLNHDRYDADRFGRIVQAALDQQRQLLKVNVKFGYVLVAICAALLATLWTFYFLGYTRTKIVPSATGPVTTVEFLVDPALLNVMTPILLGLLVVAALLPNLTKLKLPGFEAEVSAKENEPKPMEPSISSGPRGDIGFGSSLPIIEPESR